MIRFHLAELMGKYRLSLADLHTATNIPKARLSKYRNSDTLPMIDNEGIEQLCQGLSKCAKEKVKPSDLVSVTSDV